MRSSPKLAFTAADIHQLIVNQVREDRSHEYKAELPGGSDADKKEFLADVASFANANGGSILYGITEKRDTAGKTTGFPEEALGLAGVNVDQVIRQYESIVTSGLAPRVPGVRFYCVEGFPQGPVLVIHIPQSWIGPHMLNPPQSSRFFSRNSGGKYPLDVQEIRESFLQSDGLPERIRRFRDDRLARIISGETPVPLRQEQWLAIHIVPVGTLGQRNGINLEAVNQRHSELRPIKATSWNHRYNMDGFCIWQPYGNGTAAHYTQVFRSGCIEAVRTDVIDRCDQGKYVRSRITEDTIIDSALEYINVLESLDIEPPVVVLAALVGTKSATLEFMFGDRWSDADLSRYLINRDMLILPDIWIDDFSVNMATKLRPMFDSFWQAAGMPKSGNYEADGNRKPHPR